MFYSKTTIVKKIALVSLATAFSLATAQTGSKVKKLYEKADVEKALKLFEEYERQGVTEAMLNNYINNEAKEECNEEISKQGIKQLGGVVLTNKPINQVINDCVKSKTPEKFRRKDEYKKTLQKNFDEALAEARKMLTLEGCKEVAEKDKDCTDDLIVKFDRFGTCVCETY